MPDQIQIPTSLHQAYELALEQFRDCAELTGIDVGYKYTAGERSEDTLAVRFHVARKLPLTEVPAACRVHPQLAGVRTDVVEGDYARPEQQAAHPGMEPGWDGPDPEPPSGLPPAPAIVGRQLPAEPQEWNRRQDPMQPGLSISRSIRRGRGTLGAVVHVRDGTWKRAAILSCAHVLGERGFLHPWVVQPADGHWWYDSVAGVTDSVLDEDGDAAVAVLKRHPHRGIRPRQLGSGVLVRTSRTVRLGEVLEKSGCATGVTRGLVDGIGCYFLPLRLGRLVAVKGFRLVPPEGWPADRHISHNGDSGAVWYRPTGNGDAEGVGLHLAGDRTNRDPEFALACHLPRVLERLSASLATA